MTAPLDEKALAEARTSFEMENSLERAIRAYLEASPSPSMEMEVGATAWEGYWPGAGSISSTTKLTKDKDTAARWQGDGAEIEPLVTLFQAQSALAAMRAERDRWEQRFFKMDGNFDRAVARAEAAEARIKALEEALREISRDVVHTSFGAKPTRGAEIARSALKENAL